MRALLLCVTAFLCGGDARGLETIWRAAEHGELAVVDQWLKQGTDINVRDNEGRTPLLAAVQVPRIDIIPPLLQRGADLHVKDNKGRSLLYVALRTGDRGLVKALLGAGVDLEIHQLTATSPLVAAVKEGDAEIMQHFLNAGVKPSAVITLSDEGQSPLMNLASRYSSPEVLKLLLAAGGSPDSTESRYGNTCLMAAAETGRVANLKLLLAHGAKVNVSNSRRNSASIFASEQGKETEDRKLNVLCLNELIRARDPLTAQHSLLIRNIWHSGEGATLRAVLNKGLSLPSSHPVSDVLAAIQRRDLPRVKALHQQFEFNYNYEGHCFLPYALGTGYVPMMDLLWELSETTAAGKRYRLRDCTETPLIHRATMQDDVGMLDCFIQNGVDELNKVRETPLMVASRLGRMKSLARLLSAKPNLKLTDALGRNALDLALLHGQTAAAAMLRQAGLRPSLKVEPLPASAPELPPLPASALRADLPVISAAVVPFTMEPDAWCQSMLVLRDVSSLLQAQLFKEQGVRWVERVEMEKIEAELALKASGMTGAAQALAIGQMAHADLLLTAHVGEEDGLGRHVTLQVVEVRRADTVAQRKLHLPFQQGAPLRFSGGQLAQLCDVAKALLYEARCRIQHTRQQRVLALLFVGNRTLGTVRLDQAAVALVNDFSLQSAGRPLRVLRLQGTALAQSEVDMAVAGLSTAQVDGWMTVADAYCWGWCEETGPADTPYEQMPVKLSYFLWRKVGTPQLFSAEATVGTLAKAASALADRLLDAAQQEDGAAMGGKADPKLVAKALFEFGSSISLGNAAYANGSLEQLGWSERWRCAMHALSAARFFAPKDPQVLAARLLVRWDRRKFQAYGEFRDTAGFWWMWQRMKDWDQTLSQVDESVFKSLLSERLSHKLPPGLVNHLGGRSHWLTNSILSVHESLMDRLAKRWCGYPDDTEPELAAQWRRQVAGSLAKWFLLLSEPKLHEAPPILSEPELLLGEIEPGLRLRVIERVLDGFALRLEEQNGIWARDRVHLLRHLDALGSRQPYYDRFPGSSLVLDKKATLGVAQPLPAAASLPASRRFKVQPIIPQPPVEWRSPAVRTLCAEVDTAYMVVDMYLGSTRDYERYVVSHQPGSTQWQVLDAGGLPIRQFTGDLAMAAGHVWLPNGDTEVVRVDTQTQRVERLHGADGLPILRVDYVVPLAGQAYFLSKEGPMACWQQGKGWSGVVLSPSTGVSAQPAVSNMMPYGVGKLLLKTGRGYRSPWWTFDPATRLLQAASQRVHDELGGHPFATTGPDGIWATELYQLRFTPLDEREKQWSVGLPADLPTKWSEFLHDGPWLWVLSRGPQLPAPAGMDSDGSYCRSVVMLIHKPQQEYVGCVDLGVSLGSLNSFAQSRDHLLLSGKFGPKSETIENLLVISKQEVLSQVNVP